MAASSAKVSLSLYSFFSLTSTAPGSIPFANFSAASTWALLAVAKSPAPRYCPSVIIRGVPWYLYAKMNDFRPLVATRTPWPPPPFLQATNRDLAGFNALIDLSVQPTV